MSDEPRYTIETFDADGYEIGLTWRDTLREAKEQARYMLTEAYKNVVETERDAARVEIRNAQGECVWDKITIHARS